MNHDSFDIVVIGAGPSGATAAWALARDGASVLLVDRARFPRYKVCGCCLNAATLAMLTRMGLPDLSLGERSVVFDRVRGPWVASNHPRMEFSFPFSSPHPDPLPEGEGIPIHNFRCFAGGRQITLRLPAGLAVSRDTLDTMLVDHAVAAGARFLPGVSASPGDVQAEYREVLLCQYGVARARLVIAADGLSGSFTRQLNNLRPRVARRSHIGVGTVLLREQTPADYHPGTIFMACGHGGYVGLVRLHDGRLNIAAALDPHLIQHHESVGHAASAILQESGCPPIDALLPGAATWHGTGRLTRRCRQLGDHRLLVLGDAAGYVEPFTGEGIAWAMASGLALAPMAQHALHRWSDRCVTQWSRTHRRLIRKRQLGCRIVAAMLRRPGCVSAALTLLSLMPRAAEPILRSINAPLETQLEPITT